MPKAPSRPPSSRQFQPERDVPRPAPSVPVAAPPQASAPLEGSRTGPSRFRIFILDSGWNSAARRALHENFALIRDLQKEDPIYVLERETSIEFMRQHSSLIGKDPIIAVHDLQAIDGSGTAGFHGFRLHLGLMPTSEQALSALQSFVRFLGVHRQSADLEGDVRADLRREGLAGAIEIVLHDGGRLITG
jgi:hypothetical protein